MSNDKSYPVDAIGNPIRKGDLLQVKLTDDHIIFSVADIEAAGTLAGPDGQPLALNGKIVLQAIIPVPFEPGTAMGTMLVLRKPDEGGSALQ
jgi:hypothetical protein